MRHHSLNILRPALAFVLLAASLGATAVPTSAQAPTATLSVLASSAVLVGLRSGATLVTGQQGVSTSNQALEASVSALHVQSADAVFHVQAGSSQVSLAGLASPIDLRAVYRLRLPAGANVGAAVSALSANPAVLYAEPDAIAHLITTPNDPLFDQQWGLSQIGAPAAWSTVTGSSSVAIAVIDSGIDTAHPDLASQLWTNPGEIAGNSLDDDNDGHVDDLHGWNLLGNNADLSDNNGHGTEVAGIAAAATNNGLGVAGVCWTCKLMVVKVASPGGVANYSDIAAGVAYAAQKGAKVINLSLGGNSDSITLRAAIASAAASAVIVGGAGNDNSSALFYPAAYPDVLAVAGTTPTDTKVATSNFGTWVDVAAPGEAITTTFSGVTYGASSGTSLAAPFAAGLAGLLFSQHPGWSAAQVRAQIAHTAHNINAQNQSLVGQLGSGRIDAASAVTMAAAPVITIQSYTVNGQVNGTPDPGTQADVSITLYNDWGPASNLQATLTGGGAHASVVNGTVSYGSLATYASQANTGTLRINITSAAGFGASLPFTLHLTADGGFSASLPVTINTAPSITYVHGAFNTQTWTANRLYIINNNASVGAGQTLTIQPGTVVRFAGNYSLSIAGTLIADGTAQNPIQFTKLVTGSNWNSIQFLDSSVDATFDGSGAYTGGSIMRHTIIDAFSSGIGLTNAGPYLAQNEIDAGGINGSGSASLVIEGNTLAQAAMAVSEGARISHNAIVDGFVFATQFDLVDGNTIQNPSGTGIVTSQVLTTTGNRIEHSRVGIAASEGLVRDNLLSDDAIGLSINGTATVVSNTVLASSDTAVDLLSNTAVVQDNNLLAAPGHFALRNDAGTGITVSVPGNWWGTTNTGAINAVIDDDQDDANLGHVNASGFLSAPSADAPAYVQSVGIQPDATLGIQTGTFDVQFSRPMDHNLDPAVTFASTLKDGSIDYTHANSALPSDQVTDMAMDRDGSLWVTTFLGVAHFNGTTWQVYNSSNSNLPGNEVYKVGIDSNGVKWFLVNLSLLVRFDGVTWQTFDLNATGLSNVWALGIDQDNSVWVGGQKLGHLQGNNWTLFSPIPDSGTPPLWYERIVVDRNNTKWFITGSEVGVARLISTTFTVFNTKNSGLPDDDVRDIATDGTGATWFATGNRGLARFDGNTWSSFSKANSAIPDNQIIALAFDRTGALWFSYGGSICNGCVNGLGHQSGPGWTIYPNRFCGEPLIITPDNRQWCISWPAIKVFGDDDVFPFADPGRWLNDHTWRATYDFTSAIPRGAYSLSVTSAVGLDGIEIAPDASTNFTVGYAGTVTDQTPPPMPWILADGAPGQAGYATARWSASDPNSPIIHYRYAIGTAASTVDVVNWTLINATTVTRTGLGLVSGRHYWFSVQAQNQGGLWSPANSNEFVAGVKQIVTLFLPFVPR